MRHVVISLWTLFALGPALANPPGVNTIELPEFKAQPLRGGSAPVARPAVSGSDGAAAGNPGNAARMARFSAKVMTLDAAPESTDFETNGQVRTAANSAGNLCVMDIGSATATDSGFTQFGPAGQAAQPVLIRGNVINVCR